MQTETERVLCLCTLQIQCGSSCIKLITWQMILLWPGTGGEAEERPRQRLWLSGVLLWKQYLFDPFKMQITDAQFSQTGILRKLPISLKIIRCPSANNVSSYEKQTQMDLVSTSPILPSHCSLLFWHKISVRCSLLNREISGLLSVKKTISAIYELFSLTNLLH